MVDSWRERYARTYYNWLRTSAECLLCVWLVVTAAVLLGAHDALDYATTESNGLSPTKSALAQAALGEAFPSLVWDKAVVSVTCLEGCDIVTQPVREFATKLAAQLDAHQPRGIFGTPFSLFSVLPDGAPVDAPISAGTADLQLQRYFNEWRAQAEARVQGELLPNVSASVAGLLANATAIYDAATLARLLFRANQILREATRSPEAEAELMERVSGAGQSFGLGVLTGTLHTAPGHPQS